jgi:hypothetical protein
MEFGVSVAFADTFEGALTRLSRAVIFPELQRWNALVSESKERCQYYFDSFPATAYVTREQTS